eukprot:TRINITY_DN104943_c0_g1_i1.p1 TRINITY_DN104943_c0_g1~~TRINITY_DN104943_c0_g1_i1.p1  ORF type:complete len:104 (+),score=2.10 TRINITY_DN104943_c0_g1_i1:66-377(+)
MGPGVSRSAMRRCTKSRIDSLVSILYGWTSVSICEVVNDPSKTTNAYLTIQQGQFPLCVDKSSNSWPRFEYLLISFFVREPMLEIFDSSRHGMDNVVFFFKMV